MSAFVKVKINSLAAPALGGGSRSKRAGSQPLRRRRRARRAVKGRCILSVPPFSTILLHAWDIATLPRTAAAFALVQDSLAQENSRISFPHHEATSVMVFR